jgi:hypothetical protein
MTTGSGIALINLLLLWFVFTPSAPKLQCPRPTRQSLLLPVDVDEKRAFTSNLSLGGCSVNGNMAVRDGDDFTLRLHLPGQECPIVVQKAAVRWVTGKTFGFEFVSLESVERERLRELLRWVAV